jgi:hypothetical protein
VIALAGHEGRFQEVGGQTYVLASATAPSAQATLRWNGVLLAACADPPVAPCGDRPSAGEAIAQVSGDGTLAWSDGSASLTTSGGAAGRALELHFRW